jgi:Fe-S-cluster containining protein
MGRFMVNFKCHSTGHCCKDVICLPTPWDVVRIVRETGTDPREFLEFITPDDISGVDLSDPTWLDVDGKKYMMALYRDLKGCFFLEPGTHRCGIYLSRPLLCRLYPMKLQETKDGEFKGFTLHGDVGCPKNRDGEMEAAPLYALYTEDQKHHLDYDQLVEVFNLRKYAGKKPEDFLRMFMNMDALPEAANA